MYFKILKTKYKKSSSKFVLYLTCVTLNLTFNFAMVIELKNIPILKVYFYNFQHNSNVMFNYFVLIKSPYYY